jgi:cephalosporin hydroxylase
VNDSPEVLRIAIEAVEQLIAGGKLAEAEILVAQLYAAAPGDLRISAIATSIQKSAKGGNTEEPPEGDAYHRWYYDRLIWKSISWLGMEIYKSPLDLWSYQEIIFELRPSIIVEFGTHSGASAHYFATVAAAVAPKAYVLSVDITDKRIVPHLRDAPGIEFLTSSSTATNVAQRISELRVELPGPVFAILDSDHSKTHVLDEMLLLRPLMRAGDYLVVEDSNINGHPVLPNWGEGPFEAVQEYLERFPGDFELDRRRELKFGWTFAPHGFLRRR